MLFAVRFADCPERLALRAELLQAHLDWLAAHPEVLAAGSVRRAEGDPPTGAFWIVRDGSAGEVERIYETDPFWVGGLRQSVEVLHWSQAFADKPFAA